MDDILGKINIFIVPPVLALAIGLTLAVLSLVKGRVGGRFRTENVLFALTCIWWSSLLAPAFICHQLFRGDIDFILRIERSIHFFYVYIPLVNLLYFHQIFQVQRRWLVIVCAVMSCAISVSTQTEYYFTGMHTYSWGYIAKGGPAFDAYGLYGTSIVVYIIVLSFRKIRAETNPVARLKMKFITLSLMTSAFLTMMNVPAINGIDFYPMGNFNFVALGILAYGVLRYRFMNVRSVLHITLIWAVLSSLIFIPNYLLFRWVKPRVIDLPDAPLFAILIAWFFLNIAYIRKVQPMIDQLFNRRKFDLIAEEHEFIAEIAQLQTLSALTGRLIDVMKKALVFAEAEYVVPHHEGTGDGGSGAHRAAVPAEMSAWLVRHNHLIERTMAETDPEYADMRGPLLALFESLRCEYVIPFVHNGELIGLLKLSERRNLRQLDASEVSFINNIRSAASIALANSTMYQNLSDLKDNLEEKVQERTKELSMARDALWGEMQLAKKIQTVLLPEHPAILGYEISGYMKTADDVGGDYYDIINVDGFDWVVLGDVSGHGVPAGLIMMMVQTSIRSVLSCAPSLRPSELLAKVNEVITDNIQKLGEDKYMTITVLACFKEGRFYYSGLHQDIMVFRHDRRETELVETDGVWIGLFHDMPRDSADKELQMRLNDVMLLYSDGITEAWRTGTARGKRNAEDDMFGEERLRTLFTDLGERPTEEIKEGILAGLAGYTFTDDITMLILRRKA
ncbi:MAG TPA: SpoIIE family protein phosphatase [Spirochaetota bacterium]|nr:SpoIIE family protein phosphatase [Spirochaetota bacterium]